MSNIHADRIAALRQAMKEAGIQAAIFPQTDPHQSEYIADHWQVRRFLSGFTGSAGTLVVTPTDALLWVDSRYFLQAASQLQGSGIRMMKDLLPDSVSIPDYLVANLVKGAVVGINGWLFSATAAESMKATLAAHDIHLVNDFDPVDALWPDRPSLPADPVFIHDVRYAGLSAAEKISSALADANASLASSIFVSALDEIAWCLNIRSTDVHRNPVATAFLYLSPDASTLFINPDKLSPEVLAHLADARVDVAPYDSVLTFLSSLPADARVLADFNTTASIVISTLASRAVNAPSPLAMLKGVKNEVEQQGFRQAMIRDGVALVRSFMEIEQRVATGKRITEIGVADILTHYRSQQDLCFDDSFDTICGYAAHGAIVHYSATPDTDATLAPDRLLLVDSGAQYFDGTTDITRTISLGNPTDLQRRDFTLVLKGNIALDMAVFPVGTRGIQIDILAHQFLWKAGLNYFHGTGHGVGHFLNVHEGPHTVRNNGNMVPLRPGMILTDEPGLYREGLHGVRCENMLLIVPAFTTEFGEFYRFETLTLFPFDRQLIDLSLLTPDERQWIDNYHAVVFDRLSPHLDDEEKAWLAAATAPLA